MTRDKMNTEHRKKERGQLDVSSRPDSFLASRFREDIDEFMAEQEKNVDIISDGADTHVVDLTYRHGDEVSCEDNISKDREEEQEKPDEEGKRSSSN